jgi:hypothetical protein
MLGVSLRRSLEPDAQASSTQVARIVQGWLGFFFILVCHQAFAGKAVVSVRLDPSTIDRGEAFDVYITANSSGSGSDDTYACTKITLDGDSSENDHANVTLGASNIEYGPYSVTSQADVSGGAYSVTIAIYSKDACDVRSATGSAQSLHEGCDFSAIAVRQTGAQTRV